MPLTVTYQIGTGPSVSHTFDVPNARVQAILTRVGQNRGLEGLTLQQVVVEIIKTHGQELVAEAKNYHLQQLRIAADEQLIQTANSENEWESDS